MTTTDPIAVIDSSDVRAGKLELLELAIAELTQFVETNEPRVIAYQIYLDSSRTLMTVLQVHPDSESMELHMRLAAPVFRKFVDLVALSKMDVYGRPSPALLELLREKARLLGGASLGVHDFAAGFIRVARS